MNILFVCFGNISRSFLAEELLRFHTQRVGAKGIAVSSVGLCAYPGNPPDPIMVDFLKDAGIPVSAHEARPITQGHVDWADRVIVMEENHVVAIKKTWPNAAKKTEHLGSYIFEEDPPDDIMDPYGKSPYHYRLAQAQITTAVEALLKTLVGETQSPGL
jgi:protein-tyrosine-phosphatase